MRRGSCGLGGAALLLSLLLAGSPHARGDEASDEDPDVAAAPDTWPMQDACPGRTRASRGRFLQDATVAVWTYTAPGRIVRDPLVWEGWVVVASEAARHARGRAEKSWLDILKLQDGKPYLTRRTFDGPLQVALWRDLVYVSTFKGLEVSRISTDAGMLVSVEKVDVGQDRWTVRNGELLVSQSNAVTGSGLPPWSLEGRSLGPPTVAGGTVSVVTRETSRINDKVTVYNLESCRLGASSPDRRVELGWTEGNPDWAYVVSNGWETLAFVDSGIPLEITGRATAVRVKGSMLLTHRGVPVAWKRSLLCGIHGKRGRALALLSPEVGGYNTYGVLAEGSRHRAFVELSPGATVAAGVLRQPGAGLADMDTHRILGPDPWPNASVVIPARETMLAVEGDGTRLVAYRRASAPAPEGPSLPAPAAPGKTDVAGARVVLRDGSVRTGPLSLSATGQVAGVGKGPLPLDELGLVLDAGGSLVHGPDASFVARALPRLVTHGKRAEWTALASRAIQSGDAEAARAVIDLFLSHGGKTEDALKLRQELGRVQRSAAKGSKPMSAVVQDVAKRRAALLSGEAALAWTAFASLPETVPMGYRADVLRAVLALDPAWPDAVAWLRARLPEGVVPPSVKDPSEWLDVVEAAAQTPLRCVTDCKAGEATPDERALMAARKTWREDLVGLRSEHLLLVTPVSNPGRIARCLVLGELACQQLERLYGVDPATASKLPPLEIHLFESQEEYVAKAPASKEGGEAGRSWVLWTLGHYRPVDGISFLYLPEGREAFESVAPTFVHELTHHWLDRRMPRKAGEARGARPVGFSGYFLEEGFATVMEEAQIDVRARTVSLDNPRANSLDTVVNSPVLLAWGDVLRMPQLVFMHLDRKPGVQVPHTWVLGQHRLLSQANLFYAQATAACQWMLRADGGRRKDALLAWIQAYHAGTTRPEDVERILGMPAEDAGKAIMDWCRTEVMR